MPDSDDYDSCLEKNDSVYEDELEKDWGKDFDDLESSFWENYYGGPDDSCEMELLEEEEQEEEEDHQVDGNGDDEVDGDLDVLLCRYFILKGNLEELRDKFEGLRESISEQLEDNEQVLYNGFRIGIGVSKTWEFSNDLKELIVKVKNEKKHEIENGIAKVLNSNRFLKVQKLHLKVKEDHPRAYSPWTREEDEALLSLSQRGVSISEMSKIHKRQKSALRTRIKRLKHREAKD
jgi:dynactin complex subunit